MKKYKNTFLTLVAVCAAALGASWAITVGIIWLICLCFGWTFTLPVATGVWLLLVILSNTFHHSDK